MSTTACRRVLSVERSRAVRIVVVGTACGLAVGAGAAAVGAAVYDRLADWLHRR